MRLLQMSRLSNKLIGMGDSHIDNFTFFCAATCRIPGATAYGLLNSDSDTRARETFKNFILSFPKYIPLLCIGEVDCNSLPWRAGYNRSAEASIYQSIENLFVFLDEFNCKFILPSVTLPTVESFKLLGVRTLVTSNKEERTLLVKLYNALLMNKSREYGHYYLDITSKTVGSDGLINEDFIKSNSDVHLNPTKLYTIIRDSLDEVVYE